MRIALGISYCGKNYNGWQSQPSNNTIQDQLELALGKFCATAPRLKTICAGRTDSGVHALMQVVHFDTYLHRDITSWVRGLNAFLPDDIAVQWAKEVPNNFNARSCSLSRRYYYILLESAVRPSLESSFVGWSFMPLDITKLRRAAAYLIGEHDFTSFRAAACQALSPIKTLTKLNISYSTQFTAAARQARACTNKNITYPKYWCFEFEANAFLHHMVRNIMGALLVVGSGKKSPGWIKEVLEAKNREIGAPTFSANGLYFAGPTYAPKWDIPLFTAGFGWLPLPAELPIGPTSPQNT